jgi:hypothetical protein
MCEHIHRNEFGVNTETLEIAFQRSQGCLNKNLGSQGEGKSTSLPVLRHRVAAASRICSIVIRSSGETIIIDRYSRRQRKLDQDESEERSYHWRDRL